LPGKKNHFNMIAIKHELRQQIESLHLLVSSLNDDAYCYNSPLLNSASIGQHSRHIIELLQCLAEGYQAGIVNYDNRKRNKQIETDRLFATKCLENLNEIFQNPDKQMLVEGCFELSGYETSVVNSTYYRELIYNIEHAVHHMALIKVVLNELKLPLEYSNFGVAYATIQHRKLCVQ
jgi:hypothetical protein